MSNLNFEALNILVIDDNTHMHVVVKAIHVLLVKD